MTLARSRGTSARPTALDPSFVRAHVAILAVLTVVTAWFSYAYFHLDEYFQVLEPARQKLVPGDVTVLPWELTARLRPWLQPFVYVCLGRLLGLRDIFWFAFVCRLFTGVCNVAAVALFLRVTVPWQGDADRARLHVRVATLSGFLPYLFVRTSSESASMAALTIGWSLIFLDAEPPQEGRVWRLPVVSRPLRLLGCGLLFGCAFELRFQTAFVLLGTFAWMLFVAKIPVRALGPVVVGGGIALGACAMIDAWGYGELTFPPYRYFRTNIVEGASGLFGTDPPFAYVWMSPANVFLPVVAFLLVFAFLAWSRHLRHPLTWATLPFFFIHNLIAHKEERFLFPIAIFATAFVGMALAPTPADRQLRRTRLDRLAARAWEMRRGPVAVGLVLLSTVPMLILAFVPLGWNHNVRFTHALHERFGDEVHATALPEIELTLPAFHPRIYDVDKADAREVARRITAGTSRTWLITDRPVLETGEPDLDQNAVLVYSELPGDLEQRRRWMRGVDAYNAAAQPPLRKLRFRSLYRLTPATPAP